MTCEQVDELGAAYALGAVGGDERRAIEDHLEACGRPHVELREALGVGTVLAAATEPMEPSAGLRARVLATVASSAQDGAVAAALPRPRPRAAPQHDAIDRRSWLDRLSPPWARGIAVAGVAATLVLAVAAGGLWARLADRDADLRAVASAIAGTHAAHRVEGEVGAGYVVETADQGAALVIADVRDLPDDLLYELWLLDPEGVPTAAGTFTPSGEGVMVVPLDHGVAGFTAFAVTIEEQRVESPAGETVLTATLGG